jgi:starch synthase
MVTRFADQKGIDLVVAALPDLLEREVQLAVLGTGSRAYEEAFRRAAAAQPEKLAVRIGCDEGLALRLEAGADLFLMPSRYEPCGLGQMISMRYGTLPVVNPVGGLADTVVDVNRKGGTGLVLEELSPAALVSALSRAHKLLAEPVALAEVRERGMTRDFSWKASARAYIKLYETLLG